MGKGAGDVDEATRPLAQRHRVSAKMGETVGLRPRDTKTRSQKEKISTAQGQEVNRRKGGHAKEE